MRWTAHTDGFITRVEAPVKLIDVDVLVKCRAALSKRIRNASNNTEKNELKLIRDEFDFLINAL